MQRLLHGYLDGELDLVSSLEVERHLQSCQACSQAHETQQALRSAIRNSELSFEPSADFRRRVRSAVRAESRAESGNRVWPWRGLFAAASVVALMIVSLAILPALFRPAADDSLAREVVSSHVRSLMADHLTDVLSTDQHTVKPWFNGRLDFSPQVIDLSGKGYSLIGGRLDYLGNRTVAAVIYQRRQHFINLFIWPSSEPAADEKSLSRQGYNVIHWTASGMTWWAVSDLNGGELHEFASAVRTQALSVRLANQYRERERRSRY